MNPTFLALKLLKLQLGRTERREGRALSRSCGCLSSRKFLLEETDILRVGSDLPSLDSLQTQLGKVRGPALTARSIYKSEAHTLSSLQAHTAKPETHPSMHLPLTSWQFNLPPRQFCSTGSFPHRE